MFAAITSLMDNVNRLRKAGHTFSPQTAIKARLAKVRLTDRTTDLQITVCLCNSQPFLLPLLTDALTPPPFKTPVPVDLDAFMFDGQMGHPTS